MIPLFISLVVVQGNSFFVITSIIYRSFLNFQSEYYTLYYLYILNVACRSTAGVHDYCIYRKNLVQMSLLIFTLHAKIWQDLRVCNFNIFIHREESEFKLVYNCPILRFWDTRARTENVIFIRDRSGESKYFVCRPGCANSSYTECSAN